MIKIGTRGSVLALAQSTQVMRKLKHFFPKEHFKLVIVKTLGDEFQSVELFKKTNVGVFTKKLEEKLLSGEIDIAVHSLKDMPTELPKELMLAAFPKREDTRDCLITQNGTKLSQLPFGSRVGTGSARRKAQIRNARPDLRLLDLRGNLDTRVGRVLKKKELEAVVLANAGLRRIHKYLKNTSLLSLQTMMPAVGQGALGIEIRKKDAKLSGMLRRLNDKKTELCVTAERAFLKKLQGGCRVPVGIVSTLCSGKISLSAAVFSLKSGHVLRAEIKASAKAPENAGIRLASELLRKGAAKFLKEARE